VEEWVLEKRQTFLIIFAIASFLLVPSCYQARYYQLEPEPHPKAKTIIFMVPDGMGLADVTCQL